MNISERKVTDLRYLRGLSGGNEEFVEEMIDVFLRENPKEIRELEEGIKARDFDLIRSGAHRMRSTIPFVGIDRLIGNSVRDIEQMARNRDELKKIEDLFLDVKEICQRAVRELNENRLAWKF